MDEQKRRIINQLQGGFPLTPRPFADAARALGMEEEELIQEITEMRESGLLTRFGPLYNAERMGGVLSLCAMKVLPDDFDRVADMVNRHPEVAHNYQRIHVFNLWFVIATDDPSRKHEVLSCITRESGYPVYDMPKEDEYFVGLHFEV